MGCLFFGILDMILLSWFLHLCATVLFGYNQVQALVSTLENKIDETERKFEESNRLSEERLKQATEAESKIIELKTAMQRFYQLFCSRNLYRDISLVSFMDIYLV